MLYSYTITSKFLDELSKIEYNKAREICKFIETNFIKKDGLYFSVNRNVLDKKYGDKSNDQIDLLIKMLSNQVKDIFEEKNINVDFALIGKGEKNGSIKITCDILLRSLKKAENFIEDKIEEYWDGGSELENFKKLKDHFNRILLLNKNVFFIYRFLVQPFFELEHPKYLNKKHIIQRQCKSYKSFLEFLSKVRIDKKSKLKFYMSISNRHRGLISDLKLNIEQELKKIFDVTLQKNDEIIVKEGGPKDVNYRELFHNRFIVSFLDGPNENDEFFPDDLNVFKCENGMQFLNSDNTTQRGMNIHRVQNKVANKIWGNFSKNVENIDDLIKIVA
jgi:hypothetical protein